MAILNHYDIPVEGKHVVVVGRSQVIGKPVALMTLGAMVRLQFVIPELLIWQSK